MKTYVVPESQIILLQATQNIAEGSEMHVLGSNIKITVTGGNCYKVVVSFDDYILNNANAGTDSAGAISMLAGLGAFEKMFAEYGITGFAAQMDFAYSYTKEMCGA